MAECPICESEEYDAIKRVCNDCGHYDEYRAKQRRKSRRWGR